MAFNDTMFFDDDGRLMVYEDKTEHYHRMGTIPAKHVYIIWCNLKMNKPFNQLSPMYPVTREQVAFIFANYHPTMWRR